MKYINNKTEFAIFIKEVGMTIQGNSSHLISPIEYGLWAYSKEIIEKIESGEFTVSTENMEYVVPAAAIAFLRS